MCPHKLVIQIFGLWLMILACNHSLAQGVASGVCKPLSQRTQEVGCWIVAEYPLGQLIKSPVFWHLDAYPTRTTAEADKGPRGTIVESLGKVWLMTIEDQNWRSVHGKRIAEVGPLQVEAGENYSATYMEVVFTPGMTSLAHFHGGPEAWYIQAGEVCVETSDGRANSARAGGPPLIVPTGLNMFLTTMGTEPRRSVSLILHESSKPATTQVHDWAPKGLCKK